MIVGAILAVVLAIAVYFLTKQLMFIERERISAAALVAGTTCISTAGFLIGNSVGFLALGLCLAALGLLLGYEGGGE